MKKYTLILLLFSFYTYEVYSKDKLPNSFYQHYVGTIGNIPIKMDLTKNDSFLTGTYTYEKTKSFLFLSGTSNKKDSFEIDEWTSPSDLNDSNFYYGSGYSFLTKSYILEKNKYFNGRFVGKFISKNLVTGYWINNKTKKKIPFKLLADTVKSKYIELEFEKVESHSKITGTLDNLDIDATSSISTLILNLPNKMVNDKINFDNYNNLSFVISVFGQDFDMCDSNKIDSIDKIEPENIVINDNENSNNNFNYLDFNELFSEITGKVGLMDNGVYGQERLVYSWLMSNSNGIISLAYYDYESGSGIHQNEHLKFANYSTITGDRLCPSKLFLPGYEIKLRRKALGVFQSLESNKTINDSNDSVDEITPEEDYFIIYDLNSIENQFSITPIGLFFHRGDYGSGGWNTNLPDFILSYDELKDIIDPSGPLSQFLPSKN